MRTILFIVGMSIVEAMYVTNGMDADFPEDVLGTVLFVAFIVDIIYLFKD